MNPNFASAVVLFTWGAPLAIIGGYQWRHASRIAADRVATDEEESDAFWGSYWSWQRTESAIRAGALIWGLSGLGSLIASLLELLRVIPPLF